MKSSTEAYSSRIVRFISIPLFALVVSVASVAQSAPVIVGTIGYTNGTSLTLHTSSAFKSIGATTLVAFVSTNTPWNSLPVSINGVSDNLGNTWTLLSGPKVFSGSTWTLLSAIYYVNSPVTSTSQTVTVQLSNPAPLVFHVFAVSGSDITGAPLSSAITDPGTGATSPSVTSAPISVPNNTLLLSWVKNETNATASALNGYTLDGQSTSFLWAESQVVISGGSYTGDFQYDSAIGWQTAIVALNPSTAPVASNQTVVTEQDTPVNITVMATSPHGYPLTYTVLTQPTQGALSGSAPNLTYTPNSDYVGTDSFTFRANDGVSNSNTATVSIIVHGLAPVIDSSVGYINGTPLTAHTSSPLNSVGASTLVAFVSSHPSWNGLPVSINGLTDNAGNTWQVLTAPTQFSGSTFTLMSAIYYVNNPATSSAHTITAQLTNPAPLVLHVVAVSQSDVTGAPISSPITDPGAGGASASVASTAITVPSDTLLLSWVKNETSATAIAVNGYSLDSQSTSFLWAESQTPISAGSYTSNFNYDSAIGWQTAIVGVKAHITAPPSPVISSSPASPSNQTTASFTFSDTHTGVSFLCQLDAGILSACSSPAIYSGLNQGGHTFSVKAQDSNGNQSLPTTFTWSIDTTPPPQPAITAMPTNPTTQTSANFSFSDTEAGVRFQCQLDSSPLAACNSPITYSGVIQGTHTFGVIAQDGAGNQSFPATFTWTIDTTPPPQPVINSTPTNPTNQVNATFSFSDSEVGVSFVCQLDTGAFTACSSPKTYSSLSQRTHSFAVKAQDSAGNQSSAASFSWIVDTTAPPKPIITAAPPSSTPQTSASFSFTDAQAGVIFFCQLDNSAFSVCTSPWLYAGPLTRGKHSFSIRAQDTAGNLSGTVNFKWTIL